MRIYFKSMNLPKKASKRVQSHFTSDFMPERNMKLSEAQQLTAAMLGYSDWHDLEQITKLAQHPPSPVDEDASPEEQTKRLDYQADILSQISPVTEPILRQMALEFRVSAGNPLSPKFSDDGYRQNSVFYWEPYGEDPEWRYRPSTRSTQKREELYDLIDQWGRGQMNFGDYKNQLDNTIKEQPENLTPYLYILEAYGEINAWEMISDYLPELENAILKSLPLDYPMKKKIPSLIWGTMENRDYLRSLYHLARGYYALENYKKAKQWFLFLTRCSSIEMGHEKYYLKDIRSTKPDGDIHLLEEKEIYERYG